MNLFRRDFLKKTALFPFVIGDITKWIPGKRLHRKIRMHDPAWPSPGSWETLGKSLQGSLIQIPSQNSFTLLNHALPAESGEVSQLHNPYFLADDPARTQNRGWIGAWESKPSAYAVRVQHTDDVVAAVRFAAKHHLRLVVKGGGHSYQGGSSSEDSLLIWTKDLKSIQLADAFTPEGGPAGLEARPAVTLGAGVIWAEAYDAVTSKAKRYVQGGGCMTVGVAGLVQSGGFGSFSKRYGLASASLLEAEIVIASGEVLKVNDYQHPELFWAIKGGGGGSFGVVTSLTLQTHELPAFFGGVSGEISASGEASLSKLLHLFFQHYRDALHNEHWGEQITITTEHTLRFKLVFQGLDAKQAETIWAPFREAVAAQCPECRWSQPLHIAAIPAQYLWSPEFLKKYAPDLIGTDQRKNASPKNIYWKGDAEETGQWLLGYHSTWLNEQLLLPENIAILSGHIAKAARFWTVSLHFNKGLSGAPEEIKKAALQTAVNPAVTDSFALAIVAGGVTQQTSADYPDKAKAEKITRSIQDAFDIIRQLSPDHGTYLSESDFFDKAWQKNNWGMPNYKRLSKIKWKYDPEGLFFVHHGVGSEAWSQDGFTPLI